MKAIGLMTKREIKKLDNKNLVAQLISHAHTFGGLVQETNDFAEEILCRLEPRVMRKIAGIRWEQRYSTTLDDDKLGRWMRIGRVNGMTVAIITKIKIEPVRFTVHLPNNKGDESVEGFITALTEQEAMERAEKYIVEYVSKFSA